MPSVSPFMFSDLSPKKNIALQEVLSDKASFMPHELCVRLGISRERALSIIYLLWILNFVDLKRLVYHSCDFETPIDAVSFKQGNIEFPLYCDACDQDIESEDELEFDVMAVIKGVYANK